MVELSVFNTLPAKFVARCASQVPLTLVVLLVNVPLILVVTGPNVSTCVVFADEVPRPFGTHVRSNELGVPGAQAKSAVMRLSTQRMIGNVVVIARCAVVTCAVVVMVKALFGISPAPAIRMAWSGLAGSMKAYEKSSAEVFATSSFDAARNPFVFVSSSSISANWPFTLMFVTVALFGACAVVMLAAGVAASAAAADGVESAITSVQHALITIDFRSRWNISFLLSVIE